MLRRSKADKKLAVTDTLIGQGTTAEGRLECHAGLRIEGEFRGDIVCKGDVVIGESGVVRSSIEARDITVAGKIYGDVKTSGRFVLTASGEMHGNVSAKSLVIVDGAVLNGECRMEREGGRPNDGRRGDARSDTRTDEQRDLAAAKKEPKDAHKAKQAG